MLPPPPPHPSVYISITATDSSIALLPSGAGKLPGPYLTLLTYTHPQHTWITTEIAVDCHTADLATTRSICVPFACYCLSLFLISTWPNTTCTEKPQTGRHPRKLDQSE